MEAAENHTAKGYESKPAATYREFLDQLEASIEDGARELDDQRQILGMILFDQFGALLVAELDPSDFNARGRDDFQEPRAAMERIARGAFAFWERVGAPPGHAIDADLDERALTVLGSLERRYMLEIGLLTAGSREAGYRTSETRWLSPRAKEESVERARDRLLKSCVSSVSAYRAVEPAPPARKPTTRERVRHMLADGKKHREIAEEMKISRSRVSQIAAEVSR